MKEEIIWGKRKKTARKIFEFLRRKRKRAEKEKERGEKSVLSLSFFSLFLHLCPGLDSNQHILADAAT